MTTPATVDRPDNPADHDPNPRNAAVVAEFHASGGKVGGPFAAMDVLLLTTTGARTGIARTRPVAYLPLEHGYALLGDNGGRERNPAWFHNLRANPQSTVNIGGIVQAVTAAEVTGSRRDEIVAQMVQRYPEVGEHIANTDRVMPVVVLSPREADLTHP